MKQRISARVVFTLILIFTSHSLTSIMPAYALKEKQQIRPENHYNRSESQAHTINVVVGQTFTINLDSQASTGYTWYIVEPMMEDQIQLLGKTIIPYRCPGGRGKTIFRFQAVKAGTEIITFEYARPWSWEVAQRCTYIVIIREKNSYHNHARPTLPPFMLPG